MEDPVVSIIIPTYNYGHLILDSLRSVSDQSYTDWECIIVDDGSRDNTTIVVQQFIDEHAHQKFRYVRIANGGTSVAKNKGINLARGVFMQFLDADDLISKEKLNVQVQVLRQTDCAMVFSKSVFFSGLVPDLKLMSKYPEGYLASETSVGEELLRKLITNNIVTISSPLVRSALVREVGGFDADLKNNEDWLLWFKIALQCPHFTYDNHSDSSTEIRIHDISAMNNQKKMFQGEEVVRIQMDQALQKYDQGMNTKDLIKLNADLLALHRVRSLSFIKGMNYILANFVRNPFYEIPLLVRALAKAGIRVLKR